MDEKPKGRLKKWWNEHGDVAIVYGVYGTVMAAYVGIIAAAVHANKKQQAEYERQEADWHAGIADALKTGKTILPNRDGSYWVIDKNQEAV